MANAVFDIDALVSDMTPEEAEQFFPEKATNRRAPNFEQYQKFLNSLGIGAQKNLTVPADSDDMVAAARDLKYNMNEAAKERTVWKSAPLTDDELQQYNANKRIEKFEREDGSLIVRQKDGWKVQVKEPVVIRWKADTRDEEKTVTEDGKEVKKTVKIPVRLHLCIVATEAIRHRAPRAKKTETNGTAPATDAVTAETPAANGVAPAGEPVAA